MNGNVADKFLSSIDPDDPDYQRQLMRPAEIKEDVKLMEQRKRVSMILNSEAFREELEQIIESQLHCGSQPVSLLALQQIADALQLPKSTSGGPFTNGTSATLNGHASAGATLRSGAVNGCGLTNSPLPINDIRGVESLNYSKGEKLLRCKLASAFRLLDVLGWVTAAPGNAVLSARVPSERDDAQPAFLVTPYGLLAHEVTASALLKVDGRGSVLDGGSTLFGLATNAWQTIDAQLYAARPKLRCVIHVRTPAAVAISATRAGLQALSLEAVACGRAAIVTGGSSLAREAGEANVLLVRNLGLVCCADSIEEAFYFVQQAVQACEAQLAAASLGADQLCLLDDARRDALHAALDAQLTALPKAAQSESPAPSPMNMSLSGEGHSPALAASSGKWLRGEVEFEALMRYLDNAGFRTGYPYRISVVKHGQKAREQHSEVEIPPTASSLADELQQFDLAHGGGHATQLLKEVSAAKKSATLPATKLSATTGGDREVKKELKEQHARVRDQYYRDAVSSGPQSRVLDGISWNEAQKLREEAESQGQRGPAVTAASKAIIQREKQGDAVIYRGHTERNPFDKVSDIELHDYVDEVTGRKPAPAPVAAAPEPQPEPPKPRNVEQSPPVSPSTAAAPVPQPLPQPQSPQPQPQPQPQPTSPEKQQASVAVVVAAPAVTAQQMSRAENVRTQTLPQANASANVTPNASLQINTPIGSMNASASLQRPARVDRSKSERVPSGAVKAQVTAEAQAAPRIVTADNPSGDEESVNDTPAKKDKKKKEKSGIFASFSKKKEKSK